jgi:hypothetical protein
MACYCPTKECSLQCSRGGYAWLDSEHLDKDTELSAFFLRRCPSGTLLHFHAVNSVSRQIARTNQIAHQIALAPATNAATPIPLVVIPSPLPLPPAGTMQPSLSR